MQIRYHCPTDGCVAIIEYEPIEDAAESVTCPRCQTVHTLRVTDTMRSEKMADACAVCGCGELFIRKDFPPGVGLAVVVLAGIGSFIYFKTNILLAFGLLAAAALIDLALYLLIGKVTTCYACRAEYRKARLNPNHEGFDLSRSEKY